MNVIPVYWAGRVKALERDIIAESFIHTLYYLGHVSLLLNSG